ncbi:MAG: zf-HC2 domain-containing protein [Chloroflexota bacterium]
MDCTEIRPLISYYHDGEATPEERASVERHLASCEDCRRILAEYRTISGDMGDLAIPAPPVGLRRDVWRAIEAQQAGAGARVLPSSSTAATRKNKLVQFPQTKKKPGFAGMLTNTGSAWGRAIPAAMVVGAMFIVLTVILLMQRGTTVAAAHLLDKGPFSDYTKTVQVEFVRDVNSLDATRYTTVSKVDGGSTEVVTNVEKSYQRKTGAPGGVLEIKPVGTWDAGATYEVKVEADKINLNVGNDKMGKEAITDNFSTVAYTSTPTGTPTETPVQPSPTFQPTTVADNTAVPTAIVPAIEPTSTSVVVQASATPEPPRPTDTIAPRPSPTNTQTAPTVTASLPTNTPTSIPPTATPEVQPTATSAPSATATTQPGTPTATATSTRTATATPQLGTPTPRPPCTTMPVNGFGKIWTEQPQVRDRVGCPTEHETAIQTGASQQFVGGYMFWRGDTKRIYVFLSGSPNDTVGTWQEFPDTWNDGDPEPTPTHVLPAGAYEPVRGFGKLYRENPQIQQALGYATEPEQATTAAWQAYDRGYALWTSDKVIRFMFKDSNSNSNIWMRFEDTYVIPPATATPR